MDTCRTVLVTVRMLLLLGKRRNRRIASKQPPKSGVCSAEPFDGLSLSKCILSCQLWCKLVRYLLLVQSRSVACFKIEVVDKRVIKHHAGLRSCNECVHNRFTYNEGWLHEGLYEEETDRCRVNIVGVSHMCDIEREWIAIEW